MRMLKTNRIHCYIVTVGVKRMEPKEVDGYLNCITNLPNSDVNVNLTLAVN